MSKPKKKGSSVERVLQIVEVLASSKRPMSVSDLAETLEVPVPSMYRLLDQLQGLGFVGMDLPGKVTCGKPGSSGGRVRRRRINHLVGSSSPSLKD